MVKKITLLALYFVGASKGFFFTRGVRNRSKTSFLHSWSGGEVKVFSSFVIRRGEGF